MGVAHARDSKMFSVTESVTGQHHVRADCKCLNTACVHLELGFDCSLYKSAYSFFYSGIVWAETGRYYPKVTPRV